MSDCVGCWTLVVPCGEGVTALRVYLSSFVHHLIEVDFGILRLSEVMVQPHQSCR